MGFEINTDKAGNFCFNLKADNGQVILAIQGYTSKSRYENGIDSVRKNSQNDDMFDRCSEKDRSPYFSLKASNGQLKGNSEIFSSTSSMENSITSVRKNTPDASIVDSSNKQELFKIKKAAIWQLFLFESTNN